MWSLERQEGCLSPGCLETCFTAHLDWVFLLPHRVNWLCTRQEPLAPPGLPLPLHILYMTDVTTRVCCLQLLGLKSFRTGAVMLAGLLLYDVFWVFGSKVVIGDNVMLTVATSDIVSGPTRLLFPRIAGGTGEASNFPFSLLGATCIRVSYTAMFRLYTILYVTATTTASDHTGEKDQNPTYQNERKPSIAKKPSTQTMLRLFWNCHK